MKINYKIVAEHLGVPLRGNETFTELLEIERVVKANTNLVQKKFPPFDESVKTYSDIFRYETDAERQERIAEQNANIQRVDAQTKKHWSK
jgi:cell fate (sporulation/competence/biofilm development) regulator YlbF (YheA/YmcA/DUF963 family)|tara:strand:+ start:43 stop:312 length:270 start_codon:yes stop_codon:yes gene_type:complete